MSKIKYDGFELKYFDTAYNFRNYQLKLIKDFLSGDLAEVGPGRGEFVYYYQKYIRSIKLIEPDKKHFNILKKKHKKKNIKVENNTINKIKGKFQTIIYFDVLEHIKNDLKEVREAKKKLYKNGLLIFSVPAYQIFYNKFDKSIGHFKRYNKDDFRKISLETNLKIEKILYYDSIGLFLLMINKLFNLSNNKNLKNSIIIWNFLIPISKFIDFITLNKFGKSLLCILRK